MACSPFYEVDISLSTGPERYFSSLLSCAENDEALHQVIAADMILTTLAMQQVKKEDPAIAGSS